MKLCRVFCLVALTTAAGGCASYASKSRSFEQQFAAGQPTEALKSLEAAHDRAADAVLLELQKGMVQRALGDYAASNEALEAAKQGMEALYGVSVSEQTGALTLNEGFVYYKGEPFEQILVHAFKILNYIALDDWQGARVEALQADLKMSAVGGDAFGEIGFMRYLSGLVFERLGEMDSAYIDYRKAWEYYRDDPLGLSVPDFLLRDLRRLAREQGRDEDLKEYGEAGAGMPDQGNDRADDDGRPDRGELVVLLQTGMVPPKREEVAAVLDPKRGQFISVALPEYPPYVNPVGGAQIGTEGLTDSLELAEDVTAQAREALAKRMPAITARALARAVVKTQVSRQARDEDKMLGALVNIMGLVTERADTRGWSTLPADIWLQRVSLPAGSYPLNIDIEGRQGERLARLQEQVDIEAGQITVLTRRWMSPLLTGGRQ